MSIEPTLPQSVEERRQAQERSLHTSGPPTEVPGYEVVRFLGAGAYGEVWVGIDRNTGRRVAIKFYTHRGGLDWSLLSREVEKLSFLFADRYVVQLIEVAWDANPPYYVMEYLENGSLADRLAEGPLGVDEAVELFREVAVGLVHAHGKGVLHCDLKPANILLDQDLKPRLADFGQSRMSYEQTPALGTLFYMAPEQADLKAVPEARWDVYALGALLYAMLTGQPPYRSGDTEERVMNTTGLEQQLACYRRLLADAPRPTEHRRIPGVDHDLEEIIERCLTLNPSRRFPNPQAVLDALAARESRQRRRPLLVLGAVGPALLLVVVTAFAWNGFDRAVGDSTRALIERAVESNHFAARFVAESVARQVDRRWQILEQAALDPEVRRMLVEATGQPRTHPARRRLQRWLAEMNRAHTEIEADSWFVTDDVGTQLARVPFDLKTIDGNFAYRDYFHGQGQDLPQGTRDVRPIVDVHQSSIFVSEATNRSKVAFSVPVWSDKPGTPNRHVLGVLAVSVHIGNFVELRSDDDAQPDQVAVLVDIRQDYRGARGAILEHPHLSRLEADGAALLPSYYLDDGCVEQLRLLRGQRYDEVQFEAQRALEASRSAATAEAVAEQRAVAEALAAAAAVEVGGGDGPGSDASAPPGGNGAAASAEAASAPTGQASPASGPSAAEPTERQPTEGERSEGDASTPAPRAPGRDEVVERRLGAPSTQPTAAGDAGDAGDVGAAEPGTEAHVHAKAIDYDYTDPIGENFEGPWLAAFEPVFVQRAGHKLIDIGWVVVVQERYAAAVRPTQQLAELLMRRGAWAAVAVMGVIAGIWGFVLLVLSEPSRHSWVAALQHRVGLASGPPGGSTGMSGRTAAARSGSGGAGLGRDSTRDRGARLSSGVAVSHAGDTRRDAGESATGEASEPAAAREDVEGSS